MIQQSGQLTRIAGDRAWVRLGGQAGCPACDAGQGCGAGLFGRLLRRRPVELELDNRIGARPGQGVMVGVAESVYLSLVWRAYGLPLLGGLAGAVVCHQILEQVSVGSTLLDLGSLAAGLAVGALSWRWFSRRALSRLDSHPVQLIETLGGQTACAGRQTPDQ